MQVLLILNQKNPMVTELLGVQVFLVCLQNVSLYLCCTFVVVL